MTLSPALWIYLAASRLAGPLARPLLNRRLRRGKEDAARLSERLGHASVPRPEGRLIWLHGASVGEAMSILPLIDPLRARSGASILVTTGTVTSAQRLAGLLPEGARHQFVPVDTVSAVSAFLDHWRPDLAIWVESELWPCLIARTTGMGIPMALINARMSEASARGWSRAPKMARSLLSAFDLILTQDHETIGRLERLGASARFGGNLKALAPCPAVDAAALANAKDAIGARPVWLAASTHPGEEAIVAEAQERLAGLHPGALCVLAPRHPERGADLARMLAARGLSVARRSLGEMPSGETDLWLADTLGEMGLWYRLAAVTFVGGSCAARGGHTPFEPIAMGSVVLHGPHVENFAPTYAALSEAGGAGPVVDAVSLADRVGQIWSDRTAAADMVARAHQVHRALCPDLDAITGQVLALMERGQ